MYTNVFTVLFNIDDILTCNYLSVVYTEFVYWGGGYYEYNYNFFLNNSIIILKCFLIGGIKSLPLIGTPLAGITSCHH